MCDGVTQGQTGMELSLFSRDIIAMAAGIGLSHNVFDAAIYLGVCDKIVPGLIIAAATFGYIPSIFLPAGPMTSGLPNDEKAKVRQLFATGEVGREELMAAEMASYHGSGTCTFYGTANTNQMLLELMGLQLPGASFVNPGTPLREALTRAAAERVVELTQTGNNYRPLARMVDERAIVNAVVGLLATGGSTNHTIHLVAIARAAGVILTWDDFDTLSRVVPLLARVYPNGEADVNHFHAAGGISVLTRELISAGLLHEGVLTVAHGDGLGAYGDEPVLRDDVLSWTRGPEKSGDASVISTADRPFSPEGGIRLLQGNLGRAIIKSSSVAKPHWRVAAPAIVFDDQLALLAAHEAGRLERDFVAVVRYQGPRANGMPELHQLTPILTSLQGKGFSVALVTDGRMSGASGKVPAAIHVTPEALEGGALALVRTGDQVCLDITDGTLDVLVDADEWAGRLRIVPDQTGLGEGTGRELFASMRTCVSGAEAGASTLFGPG